MLERLPCLLLYWSDKAGPSSHLTSDGGLVSPGDETAGRAVGGGSDEELFLDDAVESMIAFLH